MVNDPFQDWLTGRRHDADRGGDRRHHEVRIGQHPEIDEPDSFVELVKQLAGDLDRQACLPDASRAGEGQQRRGRQDAFRIADLPLPADERGALAREVVRTRVQRPQRRELAQ